MTDGIAHAPDLTISPLMNRKSDHTRRKQRGLGGRSETVLEFDSLPETTKFSSGRGSFDVRNVFLLDSIGRMSQSVGQRTVVRE